MKILIINGVNLDMLGKRDAAVYGTDTLKELNKKIAAYARRRSIKTKFLQHSCEGVLAKIITHNTADALILNAGAYSHYSYALRDAIECCNKPVVEVHLTDITKREDFRKNRVFDGVVAACYFGKGINSYFDAIDFLSQNCKLD